MTHGNNAVDEAAKAAAYGPLPVTMLVATTPDNPKKPILLPVTTDTLTQLQAQASSDVTPYIFASGGN